MEQKSAQPVTLDTRGMQPPQPILEILKRVTELTGGGQLEVLMENNPFQLYDLLQQRGYFLQTEKQPDGSVRGLIRARS